MLARSCDTLLSTLKLVMILKHNNTQHRLTVEETEAYTHQLLLLLWWLLVSSCYWFLLVHLWISCSHTDTVSLHVLLIKKLFFLNSVSAPTWCSVDTIAVNFLDVCWLFHYRKVLTWCTSLCILTKEIDWCQGNQAADHLWHDAP